MTVKDWVRPRWVTGMPARVGAEVTLDRPGTTEQAMPAWAQASTALPPRPKTNGSRP